jgi:hypothetical protein
MLNINERELDAIRINVAHGGIPRNHFKAVMKLWQSGRYAPYNWCTMLTVLSMSFIECDWLADDIEQKLQSMASTATTFPIQETQSPTQEARSPTQETQGNDNNNNGASNGHGTIPDHNAGQDGGVVDLTADKATTLLKESGFRVFSCWSKIGCTLGIPLDERNRLRQKGLIADNYDEILEEMLEIWISRGGATWNKLIHAVELEERNTAHTLREKLNL